MFSDTIHKQARRFIDVFLSCEKEHDETAYNVVDVPFLVDTAIRKMRFKSVHSSSGAYRTAILLSNVVFKLSQNTSKWGKQRLRDETRFILNKRKHARYGRHFPKTELIAHKGILMQIQERVRIHDWRLTEKYESYVADLGEALGIDDIHSDNYGWKGSKGKEYPVFIDVDLRTGGRPIKNVKQRSWFV